MNKETRIFIWGLILLLIGIFSTTICAICIFKIDKSFSVVSWVGFVCGLITISNAIFKIQNTTS